jgi:hypothetical protein
MDPVFWTSNLPNTDTKGLDRVSRGDFVWLTAWSSPVEGHIGRVDLHSGMRECMKVNAVGIHCVLDIDG